MMHAALFVVLAADPSGLVTELETAREVRMRYLRTNETIVVRGDEVRRLAPLVKYRGEVSSWDTKRVLATNEVFDIDIGDKNFVLVGWSKLAFGPIEMRQSIGLEDTKFFDALRAHFVAPKIAPEHRPRITQTLTDVGEPSAIAIGDGSSLLVAEPANDRFAIYSRSLTDGKLRAGLTFEHELLKKPTCFVKHDLRIYVAGTSSVMILEKPGTRRATYKILAAHREPGFFQPKGLAVSPDGKYLYSICGHTHLLFVFSVERSGKLIRVESFGHKELEMPTAIAVTDDHVYVTSHKNALLIFKRDRRSGEVQFAAVERDVSINGVRKPENRGLMFASGLALDGRRLYTIGYANAGDLSLWELNDVGLPTFVKRWDATEDVFGIGGAKSIVLGPDEKIWIAGQRDGAVAWLDRLNKRGMVTFGGKIEELPGVYAVAVSPDGKWAYAASKDCLWTIALKPPPNDDPYGLPPR
jgi:hypothetical protein